ncbi:hypothetical protein V500_06940 [Pseudogymnoascus sp. VKM F-4518 (FW-2643)]|nr:hypothetical protein V500_06940 [Pseudogymnoascus sp. VKM F-4518 (FW-2643)]
MAGFFSRLKGKDGPTTLTKSKKGQQAASQVLPAKPKWSDAWTRTSVEAEEVQELLKGCTIELKSRALDVPFFLLPFRPTSDPSAARTFIRNYFDGKQALHGDNLLQELRLTEPMVLCSVVKWCWSRLAGGVVTWDSYEMFRIGELDSEMARDSFTAFIPVGADSDARSKIIFDFFDLLAAVAAHGKKNGLGGRKLSRLAGWWAFDHGNKGEGFDGGYKGWSAAADATSHLFFAYLRSMSPESVKGVNGISTLPISLQKLVQETEYPPMAPTLMLYSTPKVAMIVESVSPTPFALLRRANNFVYRDEDHALQEFSNYDDPVKALSDECRRVLRSISSSNQTQVSNSKNSTGLKDASWSRFEDIGFSGAFDEAEEDQENQTFGAKRRENAQSLRSAPHSKTLDMGRPTTPSWADFLSSGFVDEKMNNPTPLLLPPDKILPPIETSRGRSSQSHRPRLESDRTLEPGELASITKFDLDDSFWWVWISSLAGEETAERKAAFGRCALVETVIPHGKWLVIEEQVKGAAPAPEEGAYLAEKKSRFGWTKRGKGVSRSKSSTAKTEDKTTLHPSYGTAQTTGSRTNIGPDQYARIQATAVQLQQKQRQQAAEQETQARRGRGESDSGGHMKTNSVLSMQPVIMTELSPAMKWARKYDKDAVREAYLTNDSTGKGAHTNGNGYVSKTNGNAPAERDLPAIPPKETKEDISIAPAALPPTPPKQVSNLAAEKAAEVGLPVSPHPAERPRPTTPLKRNPESQSHLITPPKKTQQQSLAQFLETTEANGSAKDTPESPDQHNKLKKKSGGGGFKKMFGRNKNRDSIQSKPPSAAPASAAAVEKAQGQLQSGGATLGRRFSGFRKKSQQDVSSFGKPAPSITTSQAPASIAESEDRTPTQSPEIGPGQQAFERSYNPSVQESLSRVDTADAHEARQAFSSFDQGPLEDVPAFAPEASPQASPRHSFDAAPAPSKSPAVLAAIEKLEKKNAVLTKAPKTPSAAAEVGPDGKTVSPVGDRWAQIRKNAAERAAARQSEDQKSAGTDGEGGETSGEETIESRVARIKARVAELTGNMENGAPVAGGPARR